MDYEIAWTEAADKQEYQPFFSLIQAVRFDSL